MRWPGPRGPADALRGHIHLNQAVVGHSCASRRECTDAGSYGALPVRRSGFVRCRCRSPGGPESTGTSSVRAADTAVPDPSLLSKTHPTGIQSSRTVAGREELRPFRPCRRPARCAPRPAGYGFSAVRRPSATEARMHWTTTKSRVHGRFHEEVISHTSGNTALL